MGKKYIIELNDECNSEFKGIMVFGLTQEKPFPFVIGQPAEMLFGGKWVKGKIVAGYRFNDGVVTIETEDGRRFWCGQDRTDIYRPYQEAEA